MLSINYARYYRKITIMTQLCAICFTVMCYLKLSRKMSIIIGSILEIFHIIKSA